MKLSVRSRIWKIACQLMHSLTCPGLSLCVASLNSLVIRTFPYAVSPVRAEHIRRCWKRSRKQRPFRIQWTVYHRCWKLWQASLAVIRTRWTTEELTSCWTFSVCQHGSTRRQLRIAVYKGDTKVIGEMFSTIARLSIRDEFCQKVSDLQGVRIVLESLEDNMEDKVSIKVM